MSSASETLAAQPSPPVAAVTGEDEFDLPETAWRGHNGKAPPVVLTMTDLLRSMRRIDVVCVVDALLERFQDEDVDGVVAQCIASMRVFRDETGVTSSVRYAAWHKDLKRPHPHPSLSRIRSTLGGPEEKWSTCKLIAFGEGEFDPRTLRLRREPPVRPEDCEAAGRLWLEHRARHGDVSEASELAFLNFARDLALRDDRPLVRVPLTTSALKQHFGGWFGFLAHLGVLVDDPAAYGEDTGGTGLSDDDRAQRRNLVLAVRAYAAATHGPLGHKDFLRFVRDASGDAVTWQSPTSYSVTKFFGGFDGLIACAGLRARRHDSRAAIEPPDWDVRRVSSEKWYTNEQILEVVDAAARANGGDLIGPQLVAYVKGRRADARKAGLTLRMPGLTVVRERFGGVPAALAKLGYITELEAEMRSSREYPVEMLEELLIAAMLEYTPECSQWHHREWADRNRKPGRRIPTTTRPFAAQLGDGDFETAKRNVVAAHPETEWPTEPAPGLRRRYTKP